VAHAATGVRVVLVGAEIEENLSIRYLSAAAQAVGVDTELVAFNESGQQDVACHEILEHDPLVVGISMPFQARAPESLALARRLRDRGYTGHITVGGHFPTIEYENILHNHPSIDSVVRHEGERTLPELCLRLSRGETLADLPGLATRRGEVIVVADRRRLADLDDLAFPDRRGRPRTALGVPYAPVMGSRGCYGDCAFCCIHAFSRHADGPRYRRRSPESIVHEIALDYRQRGVRIFVFHDDNFLVPSRQANLERCRQLRDGLRGAGLGDVAFVIKCRPNDVDEELFALLKEMGLIRVYVGIESNSREGLLSLNRRVSQEENRRALCTLERLDIYHSFNLLIFDPEATLDGIRANLEFMEEFAESPSDFCRAEIYAGTQLRETLDRQGRLVGDYLAWGYAMRTPAVEMLFRIATTAFAPRNLRSDGVANLNMGARFAAEVLHRFHPGDPSARLRKSLRSLSRAVACDTVAHMRSAIDFVTAANLLDDDACREFTIELARSIASKDLAFVTAMRSYQLRLEEAMGATCPVCPAPAAIMPAAVAPSV
jgi:anaerobic magnesium-protoporphyrin IX monomethyl ester cyclase